MKPIRMVDLHSQYLRHKAEIDQAMAEVLESTAFIKGKPVTDFARELASYHGVKHCIPCGNGTDALQVAMMALNLQPGDEVITTPFTFIATIEVISLLKLKPVLVDIDPATFNLDPAKLEAAITGKTRAIVPIHLFGQSADMNRILPVARKHDLFVIEDNAQAIGTDYTLSDGSVKRTGTMGEIGCTSFFPSKNLGAYGDGGAMVTDHDDLAEQLRAMVNHGMKQKYHYVEVGVNSRLDTLQAAVLRIKLQHLNAYIEARQSLAASYDEAFGEIPGLQIPVRDPMSTHTFHQYTLRVASGRRDALKAHLQEAGVPAMIYYPMPLHLQDAYAELNYKPGDFPVTEEACREVLSLPMHTEMEEDQRAHIIESVHQFFGQ